MSATLYFQNLWTNKIRSARTHTFVFHTQGYGNEHELNAKKYKNKRCQTGLQVIIFLMQQSVPEVIQQLYKKKVKDKLKY